MSLREPIVWLNGALLPVSRARISPFDRGFTVGCGAFETLRARRGRTFAATRHWRRLVQSCRTLGIRPPIRDEFLEAIDATLAANGLSEARVRFTVTPGESSPQDTASAPTCLVHAVPAQRYPRAEKVVTVPWRRNPASAISGAKCSSYAGNIVALDHAHRRGAGEAVFANTRGELCEGATTNVFVVRRGRALTPPLSSGCLPGVTRELVLEICRSHGAPVEERRLPFAALKDAEEAFLTSSTRGVQPIAQVDGRRLSRAPGATTRRIAGLYRKFLRTTPDP